MYNSLVPLGIQWAPGCSSTRTSRWEHQKRRPYRRRSPQRQPHQQLGRPRVHLGVLVQLPPHGKHAVAVPDSAAVGNTRQQHNPHACGRRRMQPAQPLPRPGAPRADGGCALTHARTYAPRHGCSCTPSPPLWRKALLGCDRAHVRPAEVAAPRRLACRCLASCSAGLAMNNRLAFSSRCNHHICRCSMTKATGWTCTARTSRLTTAVTK
jgi:hypothetical protein